MKLVFVLLLLLSARPGIAQTDDSYDWNVSTDPLGWILGPNAALEHKFNDHWTFGPSISYVDFKLSGVGETGWSGGLAATYHFNETFVNSWFMTFGASLSVGRMSAKDSYGNVDSADVTDFSLQALGGYRWFWGRFNLTLGLGLATNSAGEDKIKDQNGNTVDSFPLNPVNIDGEASLGWLF